MIDLLLEIVKLVAFGFGVAIGAGLAVGLVAVAFEVLTGRLPGED